MMMICKLWVQDVCHVKPLVSLYGRQVKTLEVKIQLHLTKTVVWLYCTYGVYHMKSDSIVKYICIPNYIIKHCAMKAFGEGRYSSTLLNLVTRCK
jgi:hypothetical protein